ncbi:NADH(P)-binding-domain-containing protein [Chytriomyces sp. MP71]|nr:NADH(P)-binding-domain-containing protein [Chytriomyces sp. MP71]
MKVIVFGASGSTNTGAQFVGQALRAGHQVTVLVRGGRMRVDEWVRDDTNLTVVDGDATHSEDVDAVVAQDADAVVNAIGAGLGHSDVCSVSTRLIIEAMKARCPRARLLTVTSMGVGDSGREAGSLFAFFVWAFLYRPLLDKNLQEMYIFKATGWLDYVIARPGGLTNGPETGKYSVARYSKGGRIARADVANFLLHNLKAKSGEWSQEAVCLTS